MFRKNDINRIVRELIVAKLELSVEVDELEDSIIFGSTYGFDSTSLLEFIIDLEDTFNIMIPDEDLIPDNFDSISSIVAFISKLL